MEESSPKSYRCRLEWGRHGVHRGAKRGDILVVVDTLSFSASVVAAVHRGGFIYPCADGDNPFELDRRLATDASVSRAHVPAQGRFSLSPDTYQTLEPGTKIALESLNGAACMTYGGRASSIFVGALVNARTVASTVAGMPETQAELGVTVLACGERWLHPSEDGELRTAIEDYLGAGAILSYLIHEKSPEARVCEGAFTQAAPYVAEVLWDSENGIELRDKGYPEDVRHASRLNLYDSVPALRGGRFERFE